MLVFHPTQVILLKPHGRRLPAGSLVYVELIPDGKLYLKDRRQGIVYFNQDAKEGIDFAWLTTRPRKMERYSCTTCGIYEKID